MNFIRRKFTPKQSDDTSVCLFCKEQLNITEEMRYFLHERLLDLNAICRPFMEIFSP